MSYIRTPEHRALRAQLIMQVKPWERSTGPRTPEGKAKVSRNAFKGGLRRLLRAVANELKKQRKMMEDL